MAKYYLDLLWNYYGIVTPAGKWEYQSGRGCKPLEAISPVLVSLAGKWSTRLEEAVSPYVAIRPGVRPLGQQEPASSLVGGMS